MGDVLIPVPKLQLSQPTLMSEVQQCAHNQWFTHCSYMEQEDTHSDGWQYSPWPAVQVMDQINVGWMKGHIAHILGCYFERKIDYTWSCP